MKRKMIMKIVIPAIILISIAGCRSPKIITDREVDFHTSHLYRPYKLDVTGTDYGYKMLFFIRLSSPMKKYCLDEIWEESGIPESERHNYAIVNIKYSTGMAWSAFLFGANQMTIHGDIAKINNDYKVKESMQ